MANIAKIEQHEQPSALAVMTPMDMIHRAAEQGNLDLVAKLMDLQDRYEKTQARKAFDAAIAAAKSEIPIIVKNATGHNEKKYANFAAIASAIDPIISKHGLSYRFRTAQTDRISVTCVLSHRDGHSEETTLSGPADNSGNKNAIQSIGSTLTYLQRYSLVQALGLAASEDDDGKSAGTGATITEPQADEIRELLESVGANRAAFLKWAKVDRIEDIPASHFESCMNAIKQKAKS